jgi:hypothetical protein
MAVPREKAEDTGGKRVRRGLASVSSPSHGLGVEWGGMMSACLLGVDGDGGLSLGRANLSWTYESARKCCSYARESWT